MTLPAGCCTLAPATNINWYRRTDRRTPHRHIDAHARSSQRQQIISCVCRPTSYHIIGIYHISDIKRKIKRSQLSLRKLMRVSAYTHAGRFVRPNALVSNILHLHPLYADLFANVTQTHICKQEKMYTNEISKVADCQPLT